jgi:hypothetical protein
MVRRHTALGRVDVNFLGRPDVTGMFHGASIDVA